MELPARYFDGRSSAARPVRLQALHQMLLVRGEGIERRERLQDLRIGERLGSAPRLIEFADGASCEVAEGEALHRWLDVLGHRDRTVDRAQRSLRIALAALVLVALAGVAGYRWGLPLVSQIAARHVPDWAAEAVSTQTLALLDDRLLRPSTLETTRQDALQAGFRALAAAEPATLLFRSSPAIGANALALPDGHIVLLDELVAIAAHDEEILAVLAHELAHVAHRHGLQAMIRSTLVAGLVAWWLGDFGTLIAAAPVAILQARHSRGLEQEADLDAARRLCDHGIAPQRLAAMLGHLRAAHEGERNGDAPREDWRDYLATHPAVGERMRILEGLSCEAGF